MPTKSQPTSAPVPEPRTEVSFTFDIPPSQNSQYKRVKGGKIAMSEEAKAFEQNVKSVVGSQVFELAGFPTGDPELVYELDIALYFDQLENPRWFERYKRGQFKGQRKAKTRYKRLDTDNRVKFLQDKLVEAVGIPGDEQIFAPRPVKYQSNRPRTEVTLRVVDRAQFFPEETHEP